MPMPVSDLLYPGDDQPVIVALEPAHNVHHSLVLLSQADKFSGLDDWVYRTAAAMTPEERATNDLVMIGLYYATLPDASYSSFPVFVEQLASESPLRLRNRVLDAYIEVVDGGAKSSAGEAASYEDILADVNAFLAYLRRGFDEEHFIPEIERRAYTYLIDPPAMQQLIVGHLRAMWYKYLAVEWERVRPMLQKAVRAFETVDLATMERQAAVEYVVGRPLKKDHWCGVFDEAERLIFVPSAHVGPYTKVFESDGRAWVLFGARQPQDAGEVVPELSRAELLVRLNALADDNRLSILKLVADEGELRSQDVMARLDLSQSGASRHLQQLTAAGFLHERRCNGAKCYALNGDRLDATLAALGSFLSPAGDVAAAPRRSLVEPGLIFSPARARGVIR
jgi:DNA-binding transcriptional ArsR family regulator